MYKKLLLFFFLLFCSIGLKIWAAAPPVMDWQKCLGGTGQDMPVRMLLSQDGSIYTLGSTGSINGDISSNFGSNDFWLTKMDTLGNLLWQKNFGGSNMDIGTSLVQLMNGDLILAGYSASNNGQVSNNYGNFDVWVLRVNSSGNIIWQKNFGGSQVDLCYAMIATRDGGLLLGGGSYSNDHDVSGNHGDQDFWLLKLDASGNKIWQRSLGGSGLDVCYSLVENNNLEIIACGSTNSTNGDVNGLRGRYDFWVVKLNASGTLLWQKCLGGSDHDAAFSLTVTGSSNYLVAGYSKSSDGDLTSNYGFTDYWMTLLDDNGNLIRQKNFGGSGADVSYSVINTSDGGYLLCGGSTSADIDVKNNMGMEDSWLAKIDANLNLEWSKSYGGSGNERPSQAIQMPDGGFLVVSYAFSNDGDVTGNHGSADFWIVKLACKVPQANFSTSSFNFCSGDSIRFTNTSVSSSAYNWSTNGVTFSTSNNPVFVASQTGNLNITLESQTCYASSQISANLQINAVPVVDLGQDTSICQGRQLTLEGPAGSWNYMWQDGSSGSTFNVTGSGIYSVIVSNGHCSAADSIHVEIILCALPTANFTSTTQEICPGSTLQFMDNSQNATSRTWYFPGGTPSTSNQLNPQVSYAQSGTYSVMLTVTDGSSSHTVMRVNYVTVHGNPAKPQVSINANLLTSSPADKYQWLMNNQIIAGADQQTFIANAQGFYQVEISDQNNCKAKSDSVLYRSTHVQNVIEMENRIWPNPTRGWIHISSGIIHEQINRITIYDLNGSLISQTNTEGTGPSALQIDMSHLSSGLYIIETVNGSGQSQINKIQKL